MQATGLTNTLTHQHLSKYSYTLSYKSYVHYSSSTLICRLCSATESTSLCSVFWSSVSLSSLLLLLLILTLSLELWYNTFSLLICTSDKGLNFFYSGISFFIYPNSHHMKNSPDSIIIYIFLLGHLSLSLTQKNSIIEIYKRGHCLYKHPQSKSKSKKFLLNSLTLLHTHITIFSSHFSFKILFNLFLFSS